MSSIGFKLDPSVIEVVLQAMSPASNPTRGQTRRPHVHVPSRETLTELITKTFWASYMKEEDRSVRFSVVLSSPSRSDGSFEFKKPIPFNSTSLVKLCPALQHDRQIIGVTENQGQLEIWGFHTRLKRPFGIGNHELGLLIETIEPGLLTIRYNGPICILQGQETVFVDSKAVPHFLDEPWKGLYPNEMRGGVRRARKETLLAIAHEMREIGHGGILIVVPEGAAWLDSIPEVSYSPRTAFDQVKRAFERFYCEPVKAKPGQPKWHAFSNPSPERQLLEQGSQEELRTIARLSSADGAVIVSPEFSLLAFGAKIQRRTKASVRYVIITEPKRPRITRRLRIGDWQRGTRHQSAAQFAMDQPGSIVFVVSQDGMISLLTANRSEGEVLVYEHLEYLSALEDHQ